jgi:type II secretory pathway component PulC
LSGAPMSVQMITSRKRVAIEPSDAGERVVVKKRKEPPAESQRKPTVSAAPRKLPDAVAGKLEKNMSWKQLVSD